MIPCPWTFADLWLDATCESWVLTVPELMATPELLTHFRYGQGSSGARTFVFRNVSAMMNASCIPDRLVALDCIGLLFNRAKLRVSEFWRFEMSMRYGSYRLAGVMLGVLRNVATIYNVNFMRLKTKTIIRFA